MIFNMETSYTDSTTNEIIIAISADTIAAKYWLKVKDRKIKGELFSESCLLAFYTIKYIPKAC